MFRPMLATFLAAVLLFSSAATAIDAVTEIDGVQPKADAFKPGGAEKPVVIESADEAAAHFDADNLAMLKKKVDFEKQTVLLFAWRGSGQDRIETMVLESYPEQVRFSYQRGRTRDLRPHVKIFALRKNVRHAYKKKNAGKDAAVPKRIPLWPDGAAPISEGKTEDANAFITIYRPDKPNGAAAVICPGGGYGMLVKGPEGSGIAKWLNEHGVTGVVLEYRLPRGNLHRPVRDVQRALRTVRAKAKELGCDPERVGIFGFSAGGHLASTAATHFNAGDPDSDDAIEKVSSRPDFAVLVYPVISMGEHTHGGSRRNLLGKEPTEGMIELYSNEKQVTEITPPTFLAHAVNDKVVVPENSRMFYKALLEHKVKAKYLELPDGGHGLNRYSGPMWDAWQKQSIEWLGEMGMMGVNEELETGTGR